MSAIGKHRVDHDMDFFLWTRQQAEALRCLAETRPNADIDWANLIEEVEDLGSEQEHAVESHLVVTLVHLLKLAYSRDEQPWRHWMVETVAQRGSLERRLKKNPSLRARAGELLAEAYESARDQMALYFGDAVALPDACPFALDQVLDRRWFPETATGGENG